MSGGLVPVVLLHDAVGTGLIIEWPTGVYFAAQAGGTACLLPTLEGLYLPIANDIEAPSGRLVSPEWRLEEYFVGAPHCGSGATGGLDEDDARCIDSILHGWKAASCLTVDRRRLSQSMEAWVHVLIDMAAASDPQLALMRDFEPAPTQGVLVWCNSD
jgi:hypothetical protein